MRKPPSLLQLHRYPITAGVGLLATGVSIAAFSGWSIAPLVASGPLLLSEPWRIVTSALPHGGWMHLLFNVYWLWVLGTAVEGRIGPLRMAGLVLFLAAISDLAELAFLDGGIGLSGIVYGLAGLLFVLARNDPSFADAIDMRTVQVFVIWFFFCIYTTVTRVLPVANFAHGFGALAGAGIGWAWVTHGGARKAALTTLAAGSAAVILAATLFRPLVNFSANAGLEYGYIGYQRMQAGNAPEAIKWYDRALAFRKKDPATYYSRACAYWQLRDYRSALADFKQAAAMDPANKDYTHWAAEAERAAASTRP